MPSRAGSATPRATRARVVASMSLHAVHPQRAVVEVDEALAEAGRAADVRREHADAARDQGLGGVAHRRPRLALRARHDS